MKNMKIGARLALGFLIVQLLIVLVIGIGVWGLQQVRNSNELKDRAVDVAQLTAAWMSESTTQESDVLAQALTANESDERLFETRAGRATEAVNKLQSQFEGMTDLSPKARELMTVIVKQREEYAKVRTELSKLRGAENNAQSRQVAMEKLIPASAHYLKALEALVSYEKEMVSNTTKEIDNVFNTVRWTLIGVGVFAVVLGILMAYRLTVGITRPLNEAVKVAQTVATGDLTSKIEVRSQDETGQLMQAMSDMNSSLLRSVTQLRTSAETIATAAAEIASGNQDLSARTEHQASSLEETASSMEELTSTVRQNGDNARQANQLSASASQVATKGGVAVSQVVETMSEINNSSKKIVDIISVIDGIAFQTNILALNASVEAARAGEQGRGFAVVAGEVRNLAQRSASAAREIKGLIDDSVNKVETGSRLVNEAGNTMTEIVSGIQRVNDIMNEISAATQEQVAGIEQVNQAVVEMDTVSQQNAALVEEAAAAAESLQDQAQMLVDIAVQFKISQTDSIKTSDTRPKAVAAKPSPAKHNASGKTVVTTKSAQGGGQRAVAASGGGSPAPQKPATTEDGDWEEF